MKVLPPRCDRVRSAGYFVGEQRPCELKATERRDVGETGPAANQMAGGVRRRRGGREVAREWIPRTGRESSTIGEREIQTEGLKTEKRPAGERGICFQFFAQFVFPFCFFNLFPNFIMKKSVKCEEISTIG